MKIEQEKYDQRPESTFTFAVNQRFLVVLEDDGFTTDEVKKAYQKLDFSALEK